MAGCKGTGSASRRGRAVCRHASLTKPPPRAGSPLARLLGWPLSMPKAGRIAHPGGRHGGDASRTGGSGARAYWITSSAVASSVGW